MTHRRGWLALIAVVFLVSACQPVSPAETESSDSGQTPTLTEETGEDKPALLPTAPSTDLSVELADLEGTVVTVWHAWNADKRAAGLASIGEDFNQGNQWGIRVEIIPRKGQSELRKAVDEALTEGETPDMVISAGHDLLKWYEEDVLIDLNPLLEDETIGLSEGAREDMFPAARDYGVTAADARFGIALQQSTHILLYNETWARELGFSEPPTTSYELEQQVCAAAEAKSLADQPAADGRGGLHLYPGASYVMPWVYAFGGDVVDGSHYDFTGTAVKRVANFWKRLLNQGCAFQSTDYPLPESVTPDQLEKREALLMMDATSRWSQQGFSVENRGDRWKVIPFPGPGGKQAVNVFLPSAAIVKNGPGQEVATWLFITHLLSPETQARWVKESGTFPVRKSAGEMLGSYQRTHPWWGEGWDVLEYAETEPIKPSWTAVRPALGDAFSVILEASREEIPATLEELNRLADELDGRHP